MACAFGRIYDWNVPFVPRRASKLECSLLLLLIIWRGEQLSPPRRTVDSANSCSFLYLQFISSRGNEYFCEIDEEYLTDRFNLTGLNNEVQYYQYALDLVTDVFDLDADDDLREQIEKSARHLYGLVHARYIVTTRGLAKMVYTQLSTNPERSPG